ncbi:MAG: glycerate kinase type-2 family protein [Calditrichia bacterium]
MLNEREIVLRKHAFAILKAGINAVRPNRLISDLVSLDENVLQIKEQTFNLSGYKRILVVGAGKASAHMAEALEEQLGDRIDDGLVITKYDHSATCKTIRLREAGHPVPDKNGIEATRELLELVESAEADDLVICLLSGGGSALLEFLPVSISLEDLQNITSALLGCGADIEELNTVRKHLSRVKGGQLLRAIDPATCITLIISDVIGDALESIASGPTAADTTTFEDTWNVIQKYNLVDKLPPAIVKHFGSGRSSQIPDTIKPGDPLLKRTHNIILGNNMLALDAAEKIAAQAGYKTLVLTGRLQGEARVTAKQVADNVRESLKGDGVVARPACLMFGGETTVTLRGDGKGGRNQEFALSAMLALEDVSESFVLLSCGTDGTDGPTDAAGAIISPYSWHLTRMANLDPRNYLSNNDAYTFFQQINGLIRTGPTGTNVMDIGIVLMP